MKQIQEMLHQASVISRYVLHVFTKRFGRVGKIPDECRRLAFLLGAFHYKIHLSQQEPDLVLHIRRDGSS